jgi:acetyltransferase
LKSRKKEAVKIFNVDRTRAAAIIQEARGAGRKMLSSSAAADLLRCYGIPVASGEIAGTAEEAVAAAAKIGYPVAVKADAGSVIHKSEAGGVALNLTGSDAVRNAVNAMKKRIDAPDLKVLVQKYVPGGKEIIIGATQEKGLGHLIMFGLGGVMVELLKDVAFELTPVSATEANEMLRSVKSYPLLAGYRGDKGVDQKLVVEIIQRVSQLVTDLPAVREMDLNPIIAFEDKMVTVDARIIVSP